MAKSKFDTNPLDPKFPERVKEAQTAVLPKDDFGAADFRPVSVTEDETRRFNEAEFHSYQAPFNGGQVPEKFSPAQFAVIEDDSMRKVERVGLPEKWLISFPYIPWYFGLIVSVIVLLTVPKSETKVRFHAAQGLAAHLGILIVSAVLGAFGNISELADIANFVFQVVTTIMLVVFAVKSWKGKPVHIEWVEDLTNWLEEKIKPQG